MIITDQQIAPIDIKKRKEVNFDAGDTVRVHQKIQEKDKVRIQVFEGVVIARKHGAEPGATFTVRRVGTDGIAVEKIFPLYTPLIERIEVIRKTKTRRSKIYFLRGRTPRQIREKLRKTLDIAKEIISEKPEKVEKKQQSKKPEENQEKRTEMKQEEQVPEKAPEAAQSTEEQQKPTTQEKTEQKEISQSKKEGKEKQPEQKETDTEIKQD